MHSLKAVTSLITVDSATIILNDGTRRLITSGNKNFTNIVQRLKAKQYDGLLDLLDEKNVLTRFFAAQGQGGLLRLTEEGQLTYSGQPISNTLLTSIKDIQQQGRDVLPLINFLERLLQNPDKNSVEQFYGFIENNGLIIEPDGMVLAYKGVRNDYKDKYTGTFDNSPGAVNAMPRTDVDSDPARTCSNGFHVGGWKYVKDFSQRKMVVRFDPADVGAVPTDADQGKIRVAKYTVVGEVDGDWFKQNQIKQVVVTNVQEAAPIIIGINHLRVYELVLRTMLKPSGDIAQSRIKLLVAREDGDDSPTKAEFRQALEDYASTKNFVAFPREITNGQSWDDYAIVESEFGSDGDTDGINKDTMKLFRVDVIVRKQSWDLDSGKELARRRYTIWDTDQDEAGIKAVAYDEVRHKDVEHDKSYYAIEFPEQK